MIKGEAAHEKTHKDTRQLSLVNGALANLVKPKSD
jgi:hypothetical protein